MERTPLPALAVLAAVLLASVVVTAPAAAAPDADCGGSGGGTMIVADSGFTVEYNGSEPLHSELAFRGDDEIRVPDVNLSSGAASSVRLEDGTGPETCLAAVDASPGTIHVDPDGEQAIDVDGTVETLSLADADYGSGSVDLAYAANGDWTLSLYDTGFSQGASVEAVSASGSTISTGTVGANGVLTLALPYGDYDVDLQQAGGGPSQPSGSPQFSIGSAAVNATQVTAGEAVGVTAEVRNDGNASGQYTATLTADGQSVDSATVTVAANDAESVTLSTTFTQNGTYQLAVDGQSAGTVTVGASSGGSSSVSLSELRLDPSEAERGDTVTVTGRIENTGSQWVTEDIALTVDGQDVETQSFQLGPGGSESFTFEYTVQATGEKTVAVDGQQVGTVQVAAQSGSGSGGGSSLPWLAVGAVVLLLAAVVVVGYTRYGGGSGDGATGAAGNGGADAGGDATATAASPEPQSASEKAKLAGAATDVEGEAAAKADGEAAVATEANDDAEPDDEAAVATESDGDAAVDGDGDSAAEDAPPENETGEADPGTAESEAASQANDPGEETAEESDASGDDTSTDGAAGQEPQDASDTPAGAEGDSPADGESTAEAEDENGHSESDEEETAEE